MYDPCTNSVVLGISSGETLAHYLDQYLACDNTRINQRNKMTELYSKDVHNSTIYVHLALNPKSIATTMTTNDQSLAYKENHNTCYK